MARRVVLRRDGSRVVSRWKLPSLGLEGLDPAGAAERALLQGSVPVTPAESSAPHVGIVDLFAGCGGLSLGLTRAAAALGRSASIELAVDLDASALAVLGANFPETDVRITDVTALFPSAPGSPLTANERELREQYGGVEILAGGPPCQGHSAFNNRTRHNDPKNRLYLVMARAAEVLEPNYVVIENVNGVLRDRGSVVDRTASALTSLGYEVSLGSLSGVTLGLAQSRRRLVLVASRNERVSLEGLDYEFGRSPRDLRWAIGDLADEPPADMFSTPARLNRETRRRIDYLFDHDLLDLPNDQRPVCHSKGNHTYTSVYGRLSWDKPAQTLTRGFYSMCMGRYVHPSRRRTLTAHEAARIQGFPDSFGFDRARNRSSLALMIGNAVPPRFGEVIGLEVLR